MTSRSSVKPNMVRNGVCPRISEPVKQSIEWVCNANHLPISGGERRGRFIILILSLTFSHVRPRFCRSTFARIDAENLLPRSAGSQPRVVKQSKVLHTLQSSFCSVPRVCFSRSYIHVAEFVHLHNPEHGPFENRADCEPAKKTQAMTVHRQLVAELQE